MKVQLTRKKSGEIVKPALRNSSRSSSPKEVRFNDDLEQVRHFFRVDRPISISGDSSPVEIDSELPIRSCTEWEITATNFSKSSDEPQHLLQLSSLHLSTDCRSLVGTVTVANIAFQKHVAARFTFDHWQTTSEIAAEYRHCQKPMDGYDQFQFVIELPDQADLQTKTLLLCVWYRVNGQEYWDNNSGKNFHVNFTRISPVKGRGASGKFDEAEDLHHRFSERYDFTASLRAISRTTHHAEQTQCSVLESKEPNGSKHREFWTASLPWIQNRSRSDVNSAAYKEMIQNFCHFNSWSSANSFDEIPQLLHPKLHGSESRDSEQPCLVQFQSPVKDQGPESSKASHAMFCSSDLHLRRRLSHSPIACSAF